MHLVLMDEAIEGESMRLYSATLHLTETLTYGQYDLQPQKTVINAT